MNISGNFSCNIPSIENILNKLPFNTCFSVKPEENFGNISREPLLSHQQYNDQGSTMDLEKIKNKSTYTTSPIPVDSFCLTHPLT
jgi:hypothetical protein